MSIHSYLINESAARKIVVAVVAICYANCLQAQGLRFEHKSATTARIEADIEFIGSRCRRLLELIPGDMTSVVCVKGNHHSSADDKKVTSLELANDLNLPSQSSAIAVARECTFNRLFFVGGGGSRFGDLALRQEITGVERRERASGRRPCRRSQAAADDRAFARGGVT